MIGATLVLTIHGMKDETLLAILATEAVGIAQTIAGVPKPNMPPLGTTVVSITQTPPDPPQPVPAPTQTIAGIDRP